MTSSRTRLIVLALVLLPAPALGLAHAAASKPPAVHATRFVSPAGSDAGACLRASPCRSFERAYLVARQGETVEVGGGTYPPQVIPIDPRKTGAADVVFQPAPRARVTIGCPDGGTGCIDILGNHVTIKWMRVASLPPVNGYPWQGSVDTERGCADVTLVGLDAGSINAVCRDLKVIGGDWGPTIDPHNSRIDTECVNCLFTNMLMHDYAIAQGGHMECITFEGGTNVTIRNSEFRSCSIFSIFAKPGDPINGALIENNVFWNPRGFDLANDIRFTNTGGGSCRNIVIRYNLISDNVSDDCGTPLTVVGNIQLASQSGCSDGWDYNVFVDARPCGNHAVETSRQTFVAPKAGNFHLVPGSPAIGRGSPRSYPRADKDGRRRPTGALPDAGPYEVAAKPVKKT
jgi:hypothetical protein